MLILFSDKLLSINHTTCLLPSRIKIMDITKMTQPIPTVKPSFQHAGFTKILNDIEFQTDSVHVEYMPES